MSPASVGRIWPAFGLKPHRSETFKLSTDPLFIEKVRDVVGPLSGPPGAGRGAAPSMRRPRFRRSTDSSPIFPLLPGVPERRSHDYMRHGTTHLFAALELCDGKVIPSTHSPAPGHRVQEVLGPDRPEVPTDSTSTSSSRTTPPTRRRPSRGGCSPTPDSTCTSRRPVSSWLNLVERWFAEMTTKKIRRGAHRSVTSSSSVTSHSWIAPGTRTPVPTSGSRRPMRSSASLARYCSRISEAALVGSLQLQIRVMVAPRGFQEDSESASVAIARRTT